MDTNLFALFGKIGGISGLSLALVLVLYGKALSLKIFPTLTPEQAYRLVRLLILCTALFGFAGLALGTLRSNGTHQTQVIKPSHADSAAHVFYLLFSGTVRDGSANLSRVKINMANTITYTNDLGEFLFKVPCPDSPAANVAFSLSKTGYDSATRYADLPGINQSFTMSKTKTPMTRLTMLLFMLLLASLVQGQTIILKGMVRDQKRQPVGQAHIRVDGGLGEATSDNAGHFHLQLSQVVKLDQTIMLRCEDPRFILFTSEIQASQNLIVDIALTRRPSHNRSQLPHHSIRARLPVPRDSIIVDTVVYQTSTIAGIPLSETFPVTSRSRHNQPEEHVVIPYLLKDPNGIITRIERSCTSPDNNNRCRLNYMLHDFHSDPDRFGDFAAGYGGTPEYLPDCHLNAAKNGFQYYRKWVGGECTEVYTIFYKVPVMMKVKRPK